MLTARQENAKQAVAGMLASENLTQVWDKHHVTRKDENGFKDLASELLDVQNNLRNHPQLIKFMYEFVELHIGAIPKNDKSAEMNELRDGLYGLSDFLANQKFQASISDDLELPEHYEHLLEIFRKQTAQDPVRPLYALYDALKSGVVHVYDDVKDHPIFFTGLLSTSLAGLWWMKSGMGNTGTYYVDPTLTAVEELSFDDVLSAYDGDPTTDTTITIDPSQINVNSGDQFSCHDHLTNMVGPDAADFIKTTMDLGGLFPDQCMGFNTFVQDAHTNLNNTYDFFGSRLDFLLNDTVTDAASKVIPEGPFKDAITMGAQHATDFWIAYNTVENVVIHPILTLSVALAVGKLGVMEPEELKHLRQDTTDFLYRTATTTPLSYLLMASGSTYAYMANSGINPEMVWMGLGGMLAGNALHRAFKATQATKEAVKNTLNVKTYLTRFSNANDILYGSATSTQHSDSKPSGWNRYIFNKAALGAAVATIATTCDVIANQGQFTGAILGGGSVTAGFVAYNIPEEIALHSIFGIAGMIIGGTCAVIRKGYNRVFHNTKDID